jgi:hypothetical protein
MFGDLVNRAATDSLVCSGVVSALRSIHIKAVLTADWHFAGSLGGLRTGYSQHSAAINRSSVIPPWKQPAIAFMTGAHTPFPSSFILFLLLP